MASGGSDLEAEYALSKLLQMGRETSNGVTIKEQLREALETSSKDLEKKMFDPNPMFHDPQKVAVDQKKKHYKTEYTLKINDGEFKKAKSEATTKIRKLAKALSLDYEAAPPDEALSKLAIDTITSLQSEVASLDVKVSLDDNEEIKKDHTLVHELEKQVEKLPMELQLKNNFKEALETTLKDLEKKMFDLNPTLHDP
nr:myosin heavy chain-related protein [Tanacetum cinerariifolium]